MVDGSAGDPASREPPVEPVEPEAAAFPPEAPPLSPAAPPWSKAYDLPSARKVVSTGLQLVLDTNGALRRASIYIGLLALGAFGPTVLLLLVAASRLMGNPEFIDAFTGDPSGLLIAMPWLVEPLMLIYALIIIGVFLLLAISIDAQAIAISILAGRAADQPVRLWEAITRARQSFWRLAGAGLLVGVASSVVALVIAAPFIRPFDSNWALSFISSMIAVLLVTPFAYGSTGIVLGDVDALEALRRSVGLFRVRPRIALVVALFTLVTAAIQQFALSASVDAATRVGELLHVDFAQGGINVVLTAVIVLAFILAFGSLTFTIAAIVAAPQVAAFLGLTYYSAGLDRARSTESAPPRGFRWVTMPMLLVMIAIAAVAFLNLPTIAAL